MDETKSTADTTREGNCESHSNAVGPESPTKKRNRRKEKPKNRRGNPGAVDSPEEISEKSKNAPKPKEAKKKRNKRKEKPSSTLMDVDYIVDEIQTFTIGGNFETMLTYSFPECSSQGLVNGAKSKMDSAACSSFQSTWPRKKQAPDPSSMVNCSMKSEHSGRRQEGKQRTKSEGARPSFNRQTRSGTENYVSASKDRHQPNRKSATSPKKSLSRHADSSLDKFDHSQLGTVEDAKTNDLATCMNILSKGQKKKQTHNSNFPENCNGHNMKLDHTVGKLEEKKENKPYGSRADSMRQTRNGTHNYKPASKDRRQPNKKLAPSPNKSVPGHDDNSFEDYIQRDFAESLLSLASYIKGALRINQRNYRESYICSPDGGKDILIDGVKNRNRALEGDEVVVQIFPQGQWKEHEGTVQKTGKVVHILNPVHHRKAVGLLKRMQSHNTVALLSPRDSRVPRIRIPLKECPKNLDACGDQLFCARITEWNDVRFARGTLVGNSVGIQGDIEAETLAIMLENEIPCEPYDEEMFKYFPKPPYKVSEKDLKKRSDFRERCIFTIDPATARDLDDAVSCELLPNGNYMVGVHISDVSYFLKENTPLDNAVALRATTTYLVQTVYHMLPRQLTMMCSLLPGEDKLAFSVLWEITPDANIVSHHFSRSVINSCTQLSYEHAQAMIDDPTYEWKEGELPKIFNGWSVKDISNVVTSLNNLALIMRKRRFDSGALRIDQPKLSFSLDSLGMPVSCTTYTNRESHRLIEEFMLLANITVATAIEEKFPTIAFLRCHDPPMPDLMHRVKEILEKVGIVLDTSSAGALHNSLQRYDSSKNSQDAARAMALNSLCSKPMTRARYFCTATVSDRDDMQHYALNVPLYTHFTSPIRRYADVMVHRLLSALIGYDEEPSWTTNYVQSIAANCNKQKHNAKKAGEQSAELFFAVWVGEKGPLVEEAIVLDVKDHSFDAMVCCYGINVRVYTDKLSAVVEYSNIGLPQLELTWAANPVSGTTRHQHQIITMFSVVTVVLRRSATNLLKVEAVLQPPSIIV